MNRSVVAAATSLRLLARTPSGCATTADPLARKHSGQPVPEERSAKSGGSGRGLRASVGSPDTLPGKVLRRSAKQWNDLPKFAKRWLGAGDLATPKGVKISTGYNWLWPGCADLENAAGRLVSQAPSLSLGAVQV